MTAKKTFSAFELNEALASAIQNKIPPATLRKLDGTQSQAILQACATCAGVIVAVIQGDTEEEPPHE